MKLNLGCGTKKMPGFINVDKYETSATDIVLDLEKFPYPWDENTIEEISLIHCLEHLGENTNTYLNIIRELYRICKNNATINIHVPHPRHDNFTGDPTHVRAITPQSLSLFDKSQNQKWINEGISAASTLAIFIDVDFRITNINTVLDTYWLSKFNNKEITFELLEEASRNYNNVISEWHITLQCIK